MAAIVKVWGRYCAIYSREFMGSSPSVSTILLDELWVSIDQLDFSMLTVGRARQ